jgi:tripartite-type tricarboxylate transporter receptor subunit TctC
MSDLKFPRRTFLHLAAGAAALPAVSRLAMAQAYPARPVRILAGFPPAGSVDITARLIGQWLSERLGQQFIIENRPGAGANLATEAVAKAPPDGYTLLLTSSTDAWNATLYSNLKFNFIRDIVPVATISRGMGVLVVNPSVPVKSLPELIAFAKENPGKITIASAGVGSGPHMYWELLRSMTRINMLHVPYRGGGPALTDLVAGQVQSYFSTLIAAIQYVRAGTLRPLAVSAATRADILPDVPAVAEFVPGYEATAWFGLAAPKGTPSEIVEKLNKEVNASVANPAMKARFAELGDTMLASSPTEFAKLIATDTEKWAKVIRATGIKAE